MNDEKRITVRFPDGDEDTVVYDPNSPFGKAAKDAQAGDVVQWQAPIGTMEATIVSIEEVNSAKL